MTYKSMNQRIINSATKNPRSYRDLCRMLHNRSHKFFDAVADLADRLQSDFSAEQSAYDWLIEGDSHDLPKTYAQCLALWIEFASYDYDA